MMIGQKNLIAQLEQTSSLDKLPKSIIISGQKGMGKHTFSEEIAKKFGIAYQEIDYELTPEILNEIYAIHRPTFYRIDFDKLSANKRIERFQNTLLKFIEEPPQFVWIVLLISDLSSVLETIKNRCQIYNLKPYSLEELREIAQTNQLTFEDSVLSLLHTPGNILSTDIDTIRVMQHLSSVMLTSLVRATPSNALSIRDKFFDENALDLDLFLIVFNDTLLHTYLLDPQTKYVEVLNHTNVLRQNLRVMNVNKKDCVDNWLMRIKGALSK